MGKSGNEALWFFSSARSPCYTFFLSLNFFFLFQKKKLQIFFLDIYLTIVSQNKLKIFLSFYFYPVSFIHLPHSHPSTIFSTSTPTPCLAIIIDVIMIYGIKFLFLLALPIHPRVILFSIFIFTSDFGSLLLTILFFLSSIMHLKKMPLSPMPHYPHSPLALFLIFLFCNLPHTSLNQFMSHLFLILLNPVLRRLLNS